MCVCVRGSERKSEYVCAREERYCVLCVCEREREMESVCERESE